MKNEWHWVGNLQRVDNPMPLVFPNTGHSALNVGRAILPAAAFQAALSGCSRVFGAG
jgi:hypothetical protein